MAGAVSDLDPGDGPFLMLDIGGGSTELVTGSGADDPDLAAVSMQIGCVRVTERFLTSDPPTAAELGEAESMVARTVGRRPSPADPRFLTARRLVGSGRHGHHPGIPADGAGRLRPPTGSTIRC